MMQYIQKHCIFCQKREELKELYLRNFKDEELTPEIFSARRFSDHFHYKIVRCKNCGLVFSGEVLPDDILSKLYAESKVTFENYSNILRRDYIRPLLPYLGKMNKSRALEIGCSSGFFLEELLNQGFHEVHGCEPSVEAKTRANNRVKENIYTGFFGKDTYAPGSYDLICSFQTLDHLNNPLETVKICRDILRPGGCAYFITHDVDAWQAKILKEKSPIIDVEHIYLFNKNTLRRLLEEAGFTIVKVGNLKNSYPLNYWMRLLFKESKVGRLINMIIERMALGYISIPISAGNIFIIAKRRME